MNTTGNRKIEIAPAIGIIIILTLLVLVGALLYRGLVNQEVFRPNTIIDVDAAPEENSIATSTEVELSELEVELEAIAADLSTSDAFGLDELDAELLDFADFDTLLDFTFEE